YAHSRSIQPTGGFPRTTDGRQPVVGTVPRPARVAVDLWVPDHPSIPVFDFPARPQPGTRCDAAAAPDGNSSPRRMGPPAEAAVVTEGRCVSESAAVTSCDGSPNLSAERYAAYLATPAGRLRCDVAFANLEEFLPRTATGRLHALDLGGGTGEMAIRLARLGV